MSKRKNNIDSLLAAIKRQALEESTTASVEGAKLSDVTKPAPRNAANPEAITPAAPQEPSRRIGQKVTIWMHDEDRKLVREIAAWLAGQGLRLSDSMVIRAALRFVKTGAGFFQRIGRASALDGSLQGRAYRVTVESVLSAKSCAQLTGARVRSWEAAQTNTAKPLSCRDGLGRAGL